MKTYRQGDVLLIKLEDSKINRENAKVIAPDAKRGVVLAYGEVTGHAHELDPQICSLFNCEENSLDGRSVTDLLSTMGGGEVGLPILNPNDRLLSVRQDTTLRHTMEGGAASGDHGEIPIEKGTYLVRRQREYDPEQARLVQD